MVISKKAYYQNTAYAQQHFPAMNINLMSETEALRVCPEYRAQLTKEAVKKDEKSLVT